MIHDLALATLELQMCMRLREVHHGQEVLNHVSLSQKAVMIQRLDQIVAPTLACRYERQVEWGAQLAAKMQLACGAGAMMWDERY